MSCEFSEMTPSYPVPHSSVSFRVACAFIKHLLARENMKLTIFWLGSQLLDGIYVVNCDASGDVWPAGGFAVHNDDVLQPWHFTQYGL